MGSSKNSTSGLCCEGGSWPGSNEADRRPAPSARYPLANLVVQIVREACAAGEVLGFALT